MTQPFGERLRAARERRALSQRALAQAVQPPTTQARLSLYETTEHVPDLDTQIRLAIALDAPELIEHPTVRAAFRALARQRREQRAQRLARAAVEQERHAS